MPITKSAQKALRQNIRRRERNLKNKKIFKTAIKNYQKESIASKEEATKLLPKVYKALDKAAKRKLIKKGKASRLKSRLSKQITKI